MKKKTFTTIVLYPYIGFRKETVNGYIYRDYTKHLNIYKAKTGVWYATICGASIGEGNTRKAAIEDALTRWDLVTSERVKKAHEIYRKAERVK